MLKYNCNFINGVDADEVVGTNYIDKISGINRVCDMRVK